MAAIVKANPSLANGGLVVLKRSVTAEQEGRIIYRVDYCSLSQFSSTHTPKFRTGATPPTPLPQSLGQLNAKSAPKLFDFTTETEHGLTYYRASYSAEGTGEASFSITTSSEQRSFQKTAGGTIIAYRRADPTTGSGAFTSNPIPVTYSVAFDYISTSVTRSSRNRDLPQVGGGSVGETFNFSQSRVLDSGGDIAEGLLVREVSGGVDFTASTINSTSSTRNSDGTYTYSSTSTGIYQ